MSRGYVYILALEGAEFVKIGIAGNPEKRLAAIQTSNPHFVYVDTTFGPFERKISMRIENIAHRILSDVRARGEWFGVSPETARAIVQQAIEIEPNVLWEPLADGANRRFFDWVMGGAA